ncbi:7-carboxy-7-deazaguanine synthase QueE [Hippea jasoniae]|uniref:7-carboxy-7-deazaguanine synthase QueE n=1 Tax=Hippea jasoniae TaxID=944479 RepID=UPI0005558250|nr:7-carboxy-7-deazaguanine synthase QueE [Hippea jasoniae]
MKNSTNISEIFYSIQGEGSFIGMPAVFVRFCECNLRCPFCDTKYALNCSNPMTEIEIFKQVESFRCKNIIFTGGEPALRDNFIAHFIKKYPQFRYFIETNGTIFLQNSASLLDHIVVSPKMFALNLDVLKKYKELKAEFKFVVDENFDEELKLIDLLNLTDVVFQPIWLNDTPQSYIEKTKRIIEKVKKLSINVRIIPQLHKILYKEEKGV